MKLQTSKVQYWRNGVMISGMMPIAKAQKLVDMGLAYVISSQAIGAIIDGKPSA